MKNKLKPVEVAIAVKLSRAEQLSLIITILKSRLKARKHWLLIGSCLFLAFVAVFLIAIVPRDNLIWLINSWFGKPETYSRARLLGVDVGAIGADELTVRLAKLKKDFNNRPVILKSRTQAWSFRPGKIGLKLDLQETSQAIWRLNHSDAGQRLRLLVGREDKNIIPNLKLNIANCRQALSAVKIDSVAPIDAKFYYDQSIKIKPERRGSRFDATANCQWLASRVANGDQIIDVKLDLIKPTFTKAELGPKSADMKLLASKSLSITAGSYSLTISPAQLLDMFKMTKTKAKITIDWDEAALDKLVSDIANKVDEYTVVPTMDRCQYLVSAGGNRLDKAVAKSIIKRLKSAKGRDLKLDLKYNDPQVGTRLPVQAGNSGTIYLTFDDGFDYADQIMNYAACYGIKVTFFEVGARVYQDAAGIRRAIAEGHSVQSHGYEHAVFNYGTGHDYAWQRNDIANSISAIANITGVRPTYFRPPGGNKTADTYSAASANGIGLVLWSLSSIDTNFETDGICANVLNGAFDGAIVLMHSTKQKTANAIPCIVEGLAAKGYNMRALR